MAAPDANYYIAKASQCFRLAAACTDEDAAFSLRQLGHEFARQALQQGADPKLISPEWLRPPVKL